MEIIRKRNIRVTRKRQVMSDRVVEEEELDEAGQRKGKAAAVAAGDWRARNERGPTLR